VSQPASVSVGAPAISTRQPSLISAFGSVGSKSTEAKPHVVLQGGANIVIEEETSPRVTQGVTDITVEGTTSTSIGVEGIHVLNNESETETTIAQPAPPPVVRTPSSSANSVMQFFRAVSGKPPSKLNLMPATEKDDDKK
jgi:hypothetical protein